MLRLKVPLFVFLSFAACFLAISAYAQTGHSTTFTFAVSGDSRNCGDFVMPAIASKVKAEGDDFYWHLGDFRAMSEPDQDLVAMLPGRAAPAKSEYQKIAWDDFLKHQIASFSIPVFIGRGNHETVPPMTREGYTTKFMALLTRPEITAQRQADGANASPVGPWYHWVHNGVDFITLDNASHDEFSEAQMHWLRAVLDHDLEPNSGVRTIIAGMHEALPHSTGSSHAMDDWALGLRTGEQVYTWFYNAQTAGKHVYLIASHSHYYSPNVFKSSYWQAHSGKIVPGMIIGTAGAHRYRLPEDADPASLTNIYGYVQGEVQADGKVDFKLHQISEADLVKAKWPEAPDDAIHECYVHNHD